MAFPNEVITVEEFERNIDADMLLKTFGAFGLINPMSEDEDIERKTDSFWLTESSQLVGSQNSFSHQSYLLKLTKKINRHRTHYKSYEHVEEPSMAEGSFLLYTYML